MVLCAASFPLSRRFNPESNDAIRYSNPHGEEGLPAVTADHQRTAVENLKKTEIGRRVLRDAIIVPDWESVIAPTKVFKDQWIQHQRA